MTLSDPIPDDLFGSLSFAAKLPNGQAAYSEQSSDNTSVCTPKRELQIVRSFAPIGLDPCSNEHSTVGARVAWWGKPNYLPPCNGDGLLKSWTAELREGEIAFVNPPYGREIVRWIAKMNAEGAAGAEIIALLPGRFDTKWFRSMRPDRICWYGRRVVFVDHGKPDQKDSAKFPSIFAYWGARPDRFEEIFGKHGVVTMWKPTEDK